MPGTVGSRGLLASISASIAFAGVYFVTPYLQPASAEAIWGVRTLATAAILVVLLLSIRQWRQFTAIGARLRRRPILILPLFATGALLAAQLWLFGWAPLHGRGLQVSLGYFLLPLVLVIVGKLLYKDRLHWWQWLAAGIAAVGVLFETVRIGGFSWETLLVALGYPCYFVLRRALGTQDLGGMLWELLLLSPFAAAFVVFEIVGRTALQANPALWWQLPLFALASGVALILYVMASRMLPIGVFGLLGYLEPALLVVASLMNGERIAPSEWIMYLCIWGAVLVLIAGGIATLARIRNRPSRDPA